MPVLYNLMKSFVVTLSIVVAAVATLSAQNWPQWRGPALNGVASATGLPVKWSTTDNIAWKVPMPGRSGSTPIIWAEHVFLNIGTSDRTGELELWALDTIVDVMPGKDDVATRSAVLTAMNGHVIGQAFLIGTFATPGQ